jgi:glycerol-3-phosphate dehydrogenase
MTLLTFEQLQKLNTKRLLSYKRSLNKKVLNRGEDWESYCNCTHCQNIRNEKDIYKKIYNNIKEILKTREHINKKENKYENRRHQSR